MKINKLYEYPKSMRSVINGGRHYDIDGDKLPTCDDYIISYTK